MPKLYYYDSAEQRFVEFHANGGMFDSLIPLTQNVKSTATEYLALWDALAADGYCTKTKIGEVQGLPINKYVFAFDKDSIYGNNLIVDSDGSYWQKKKVAITSGMHGDEQGSPLYLYEFINRLCKNQAYAKYFGMFDFHIVPLANPTGYNLKTRHNYQNININRDATESPSTAEGQALKPFFDEFDKLSAFIDIHQMSHGHGLTNYNWSCGYFVMQDGARQEDIEKYNSLLMVAGYEMEKLMEAEYNKPHRQMFQPWEWPENIGLTTWHNYVSNTGKTTLSLTLETAQTWAYYSDSGVDLNPVALIGGNTVTDKMLRIFLDNI